MEPVHQENQRAAAAWSFCEAFWPDSCQLATVNLDGKPLLWMDPVTENPAETQLTCGKHHRLGLFQAT
jgi:hypothetical protein